MSHVTRMRLLMRMSIKYNNAAYLDWMLSNSSFEMEALARMALMSANSFSIFSKAAWKKTTSQCSIADGGSMEETF